MRTLLYASVILWSFVGIGYALPLVYEYQINATVADIKALGLDPQAEINYTRNYINSHSIHKAGYSRLATKTPLMLTLMRVGIKPPMTCGYRTLALNELLSRLGYQVRMVKIYSDDWGKDDIRGHVFSEVHIDSRWQIQDSDYNYMLPLSAYQLVADDLPAALPEPLPQFLDWMRYDYSGRGDLSEPYYVPLGVGR